MPQRILALLIDSIVVTTAVMLLLYLINLPDPLSNALESNSTGMSLGIATLMYYNAFERSKFQATPGKMLFGLKVVTLEGGAPNGGQVFGRNLARILDNIFVTIPAIVSCSISPTRQRIGDRLAGTYVVRTR